MTIEPRNCPQCGSDRLAVEVQTWMNFEAGKPDEFDPDDTECAEPVDGAAVVCRSCEHQWNLPTIAKSDARDAKTEARPSYDDLLEMLIQLTDWAASMGGWEARRWRDAENLIARAQGKPASATVVREAAES